YLSSLAQTQQAALPVESRQLERLAETRATDPDIPVWLKWPGPVPSDAAPGSSLRVLSFADVAEGRIDLSELQNKIVLVGVTALGIDPIRTPFHLAAPTSGVYLHAAIVDNLLCQRFLTRLPRRDAYLGLIVLSGVAGCLFYGRGAQGQLLGCVGFPIVWLGLVYGAFVMQYWLPLAAPIGAVWLTAAGVQLQIQRDKQQLMNLFAMSVAPETAQIIWQRKQEIFDQGELAAQELTATVLFMDIRGFTGIAEKLSSQALMDWLNEYFEVMTDGIMAHGGVVDKYIGDAIMAVFGAPFPRSQPEQIQADAVAAVRASLQMHQALIALNQRFARRQWPTIAFGIGIHTGPLIAGTVGNRHRMNYSMFGDTVNIAARLEKLTKDLPPTAGYRVLISADTQALIQNDFKTPLVRSAALRGRAKQTEIYTVDRLLGLEA
ncbi:MAG: adenylate/guanylate cyclase domain-containing protein, partial [Cyanobacteria bacterium J06627_15]